MKEKELIKLGFKKKKCGDAYWYEFNAGRWKFTTNDTYYNKCKDIWHLGVYDMKIFDDSFWFNSNLTRVSQFKTVFEIITKTKYKTFIEKKLKKQNETRKNT